MAVIKINDTYRVEIRSYDYELIKRIKATANSKERNITLGYFPSLKHVLAWLKREEVKSLGTLTIDEYINELRKLESWTGNIHENKELSEATND